MSLSLPPDYDKLLATTERSGPAVKPGMYLWEPPGKRVQVYLSLDVIDRMLQDVMRGFGAVPKRGAEVGGILLGKITAGEGLSVEIDEFELVPIEYRRGPSYLLSAADQAAFAETFGRLTRLREQTSSYPVGYFRSHTREGQGLSPEDLELIDKYFPQQDRVVLLVRPFATKVGMAGFYFRENGAFQSGLPLLEFPFRRKELTGESPAPKREPFLSPGREAPAPHVPAPATGPGPNSSDAKTVALSGAELMPVPRSRLVGPAAAAESSPELWENQVKTKSKGGWVWLPLSFIFLLLGVLLGFQASLTLRPQTAPGDPFSAGLSVTKDGENLDIRWDRQSPVIRAARHGVLVIDEGTFSKPVDLTPEQLQTGSVVYPHKSGDVRFTLELSLKDRDTMIEKLQWRE